MFFVPGCNCCTGDSPCRLCTDPTQQTEYDVTLWPGEVEEVTITVSGPIFIQDSGQPEYGCCNWLYDGILSDFTGIADEGNGDCTGDTPTSLSLALNRVYPSILVPCSTWGPDPWAWQWTLNLRVKCEPPVSSRNNGIMGWPPVVLSNDFGFVISNKDVNCDLTGDDVLNFDAPWGTGDGDCDGPFVQGCLDCDPFFPGPPNCRFPSGGADVSNAS